MPGCTAADATFNQQVLQKRQVHYCSVVAYVTPCQTRQSLFYTRVALFTVCDRAVADESVLPGMAMSTAKISKALDDPLPSHVWAYKLR